MLRDYVTASERIQFKPYNIEPIIKSMINDEREKLSALEENEKVMRRRYKQIENQIIDNLHMLANKL